MKYAPGRQYRRTVRNPAQAPPGDSLLVSCWCESILLYVARSEVRAARTATCGRPDCHPPSEAPSEDTPMKLPPTKPPVLTGDHAKAAQLAEAGWWVEETAITDGENLRLIWSCRPPTGSGVPSRPTVS